MMKNYGESVKVNHTPNWPYIPDHPYRIFMLLVVQGQTKFMCC